MSVAESPTVKQLIPAIWERLEPEAEPERQSREWLEYATDFIYIHDLEGAYKSVNPAGLRLLGYSREEFARLTASDVLAPEYREPRRRLLESRLDGGDVLAYEAEYLARDGRRIPVEIRSGLIFREGEPVGVLGIARDITERKRAEKLYREQEELIRNVLDTDPNLISVKDREGRFVLVNRAVARLNGRTVEEMIGRLESDFNPNAGQVEELQRQDREVIDTLQEKVVREEQRTTRFGQTLWLQTVKRPLISSDGNAYHVLGVSTDITERRRTEEELERTKLAAEAASRAKSEFLANMSHEIRTPMNGVIGMANLLLDTPLTPEQRNYAETARISAESLLTIINDVLDFSKIEAGKLQFETADFDLREVVDASLEVLSEPAARKGLEMGALVPQHLPCSLRGDPGRLRQVLLNLAGNAVKFTDTGDVFLSVSLVEEGQNEVKLRFDISDTGIGIEPAVLARLFQPFSQGDDKTARKYGGTGLGLAISKQIVGLMQGEIGAQSRRGAGSTFWFTARFGKQRLIQNPVRTEPKTPRICRTLVVDDNEVARHILRHYLQAWSIETVAVASGAEAFNALRQQAQAGRPFDLVMLDMQLPEMAGFILAEAIRKDVLLGRPRMIVLTSIRQDGGTKILCKRGIAAALVKPIKRTELHRCLAKVMVSDAAPSPAQDLQTAPSIGSATRPVRPLKILIAEDDAVNQKVALWQLEKLGYKADSVDNGRQVLQFLQRARYDVILMDCRMPELDGYETTRRLRENGQTVRVIAMTANAMHGDREACLEAGMDDYISKPVRIEELKSALERVTAAAKETPRPKP